MKVIKQLGISGIHHRLKRISDKLNNDILKIYKKAVPGIEPAWIPVLFSLTESNISSVQDIAEALGISHPAVIQFLRKMKNEKLVTLREDVIDRRKKKVELTGEGKEVLQKIKPVQQDIENSYIKLIEETKVDIPSVIETLENSLSSKTFLTRVNDEYKERALKQVEIVSYNKKYKKYFRDLNYEWLEKYFEVEPEDEKILDDPEKEIMKKGGEIFFARINGQIIGTCAAIKIDKQTYELAKMAVTEKAKGMQAGKKLALAVIGFSWSKKAKFITLLTNSKLVTAVNLYKSLGFETVADNSSNKYKRKVFRMTLEL